MRSLFILEKLEEVSVQEDGSSYCLQCYMHRMVSHLIVHYVLPLQIIFLYSYCSFALIIVR